MAKKVVTESESMQTFINLSLNKAAREMFGDVAESVRVRFDGSDILVRPSTRTKGLGNLPKTDIMIPLSRSETALKFAVPMSGVATGTAFLIEEMNYGWTRFTALTSGTAGKDAAVAKVVVR